MRFRSSGGNSSSRHLCEGELVREVVLNRRSCYIPRTCCRSPCLDACWRRGVGDPRADALLLCGCVWRRERNATATTGTACDAGFAQLRNSIACSRSLFDLLLRSLLRSSLSSLLSSFLTSFPRGLLPLLRATKLLMAFVASAQG